MSPKTKAATVGERLPYLLSKMKAPRVLERLQATAARAREEGWPLPPARTSRRHDTSGSGSGPTALRLNRSTEALAGALFAS